MAYEHDRPGDRPDAPYYDRRDTGSAGIYIGIAVVVALVLALVAFYAGSGNDPAPATIPPAGAPVQDMAPAPAPPADTGVAPMDTAPPAGDTDTAPAEPAPVTPAPGAPAPAGP